MPRRVLDTCIQCNACIGECPVGCITEGETQSIINQNDCIDCGACEAVCPVGAIIAE